MNELELLKNLPSIKEREWSFLETIGASQRETIIANLLAYYFDPEEKHGLKGAFIKGLLQTVPRYLNEKKPVNIKNQRFKKQEDNFEAIFKYTHITYTFTNTIVSVEVETFKQNRIDIVIDTKDLVIVIEFKINHDLNNPLNDYVNFIECKDDKGKEINSYRCNKYKAKDKYFIVLTPFWKKPEGKAKENDDFVQITIAGFIDNVKKIVEKDYYKDKENSHQFFIYQDFINTIENRGKEITMINEYFKRFNQEKEDNQKIEDVYKNLNSVKKEIEKRVIEISEDKNLKFRPLLSNKTIQSALIRTKDDKTEIKVRLSLKGWYGEKWIDNVKKDDQYLGSIEDSVETIKNKIVQYYNK